MAGKSRQRGLSFIMLILILALLAGVGAIGLAAFPSFMEYQAVKKAVTKASEAASLVEVRNTFDRARDIDNITSIRGADLEVTKVGDRFQVSFAYNKEFHMFGPAWLLMKYAGTSQPQSR
jgi:Tfp pilus assembly protein PilE